MVRLSIPFRIQEEADRAAWRIVKKIAFNSF